MVRIRLRRTGLKHQPTYRVVVADKESPRDGRFIEIIGSYNPRTEPFTLDVNEDRAFYWMSVGAQPSESLMKLFKSAGVMTRYERVQGGEAKEAVLADAKTENVSRNATILANSKK
jgi:small subunit ribosomal protein S16